MRKFSIFALAAAAMMTVGCTQDIDTDINIENGIVRGELVEVTLDIEQSRVGRDAEGKLTWSEGDQVAVVLKDDNGKMALDTEVYTVNSEENTALVPANAAYMFYPATLASAVNSCNTAIDLPDTYTVAAPAEIFDYNPMIGKVSGKFTSFKNLMGYVAVPLTGTGSLKSVTVKSEIFNGFNPLSREASLSLNAIIIWHWLLRLTRVQLLSTLRIPTLSLSRRLSPYRLLQSMLIRTLPQLPLRSVA